MLHSINEIQKIYEEINSRLDDIKINSQVNIGEFGWNEEWNEESSKYPFCGHSIKNFINNIVFDLRYGVANGCKNKSS